MIIRSKDEAERLRLTLASLATQTLGAEVIVVDDGSSDRTPKVLEEAAAMLPLTVVRHATPCGRSAASNAGARVANGELLIFLDGDTLAAPDLVARHRAAHARGSGLIGRGETYHLRGTRFLQDPETGLPQPEHAAHVARLPPQELSRLCVTRDQVWNSFPDLDRRASPGIYPGASPARLYEVEMDALRRFPDCKVLWAAASGHNLSVSREAFWSVGGFDDQVGITDHRNLALRLCTAGLRMMAADGARTYHMTHRIGWRDPLAVIGWEDVFYQANPLLAVKLLIVLWASLSPQFRIPVESRIESLPELEAAASGENGIDYEPVRQAILSQAARAFEIRLNERDKTGSPSRHVRAGVR